MKLRSPKKYPVYFSLLDAGIRPRIARRMIARMLDRCDSITPDVDSPSPSSFCIWSCDLNYSDLWYKAGHDYNKRNSYRQGQY